MLIVALIFTDSTFGLENILPGALLGGGVGLLLGFCFPKVGKILSDLLANLG